MQLNCKVIKKWQPPSPFSELSSISSKIFGTPQVTQFLEGPTLPLPHPCLIRGGREEGGGSNYDKSQCDLKKQNIISNKTSSAVTLYRIQVELRWIDFRVDKVLKFLHLFLKMGRSTDRCLNVFHAVSCTHHISLRLFNWILNASFVLLFLVPIFSNEVRS